LRPAMRARVELGADQHFGEREDAVERRTHLMRERRECKRQVVCLVPMRCTASG
jgi:hypothetical protein